MAPKSKSIFRQPGARHFQLVHRSQRDPLINDPEASQHVLKPIDRDQSRKGKSRADLESGLSPDVLAHDLSRANIGEAAVYGVYYDDTDYDYMQHLKPVGLQEEGVESILIEAPDASKMKKKGKGKDTDIFRDIPSEALPSSSELPRNYASQEAIPTEISGLQPDMNPHLRQTLEALEDEAFVDEGIDDDFFGELVAGGEREDPYEDADFEFREEGYGEGEEDDDENDENWEARFAKFKKRQATEKAGREDDGSDVASDMRSEGADTIGTLPKLLVVGGKRRRKGTSDASGYSMSSSSMFRNEGLTLLDEQFDQIEKQYESDESEEEDEDSDNDAPELITTREDFNRIMDEFLENYEILGGKMRQALPGETATDKLGVVRDSLREHVLNLREESEEGDSNEPDGFMMEEENGDSWDCETILSTYSNLENRPKVISARQKRNVVKIEVDPKTGLPTASRFLHTKKATPLPAVQEEPIEPQTTISRPKDETKEEKKIRKRAIKEERQARRTQKKMTKEQFSNERKHQLQVMSHTEKGIRKL